jgi:hypothetical protein
MVAMMVTISGRAHAIQLMGCSKFKPHAGRGYRRKSGEDIRTALPRAAQAYQDGMLAQLGIFSHLRAICQ